MDCVSLYPWYHARGNLTFAYNFNFNLVLDHYVYCSFTDVLTQCLVAIGNNDFSFGILFYWGRGKSTWIISPLRQYIMLTTSCRKRRCSLAEIWYWIYTPSHAPYPRSTSWSPTRIPQNNNPCPSLNRLWFLIQCRLILVRPRLSTLGELFHSYLRPDNYPTSHYLQWNR